MERLSLNKQVAALGHEMAHFIQYDQRGFGRTLITLVGYVSSNKKRLKFEKEADIISIDHGLDPHMIDFAFYTSEADIKSYMDKNAVVSKISLVNLQYSNFSKGY